MGADVKHQHDNSHDQQQQPAITHDAPVSSVGQSMLGLAPPAAGVVLGNVAVAGEDLLRSLDDAPAPPPTGSSGGLTVGRANDPCEAEADRMADRVLLAMRRPPTVETSPEPGALTGDGNSPVRRSATGHADPLGGSAVDAEVSDVLRRRAGSGSALPSSIADSMGQDLGQDFSGVRVHADSEADGVARSLQAKAFTVGTDIYFSKGTYDPGSDRGQHLLAHELSHVAQQGGAGVRRKMWTEKRFAQETSEGVLTGASDAQKNIIKMIREYTTTFESHGVLSKDDAPKALARLKEMDQSAKWWIESHQTIDTKTKQTMDDPKRVKRMTGFRNFQLFLAGEMTDVEGLVKKPATGTEVKKDDLAESSPGFLKLKEKYEGNAKTFFQKMGDVAQHAVSDNGDSAEIEATVKFPVDPSGVGFIGGRFTAGIEKDDDLIKIRAELAITGGANVNVAEVSGELGGYFESQADSGSDCMNLVSYALYRRARESHALPNEAPNFLWGGQTGKFGFNKAENWSLELEKKMFAIPDPDPKEFKKKYPKDGLKAQQEFNKAKEDVEERRKNIYVESGGLAGAGASVSGGVVSGEASVSGTTGRRIDFQSLENRKGGAGKDNLDSDSIFAQMARGATGGKRGAQKRVGRSVHSLTIAGSISGSLGVASLGAGASLALNWSNDGISSNKKLNPTGKKSKTSMDSAVMTVTGELGIALSDLTGVGGAGGDLLDHLQDKLGDYITEKAKPAVKETAKKDAESTEDADEVLDEMLQLQMIALNVQDMKDNVTKELESLTGSTGSSGGTYSLSLSFDTVAKEVTFELRNVSSKGLELPKSISLSSETSSRMFRFKYSGGKWTRG